MKGSVAAVAAQLPVAAVQARQKGLRASPLRCPPGFWSGWIRTTGLSVMSRVRYTPAPLTNDHLFALLPPESHRLLAQAHAVRLNPGRRRVADGAGGGGGDV